MRKFLNKNEFTKLVERMVLSDRIGYMEAAVIVCEDNGVDPLDVKKFISPGLMDKIEAEAMGLNLISRSSTTLNFDD